MWTNAFELSRFCYKKNTLNVALEPQYMKSEIQTWYKKFLNPNKSKWRAKSNGRDNYLVRYFLKRFVTLSDYDFT